MREKPFLLYLLLIVLLLSACAPANKKTASPTASLPKPTLASKAPTTPATAAPNVKAPAKTSKKISTQEIKDLETALKTGLPIVLKLGADSCPPCRAMKPIIAELALEQDGKIIFLDIDVYEQRELAREFGVRVIPTIIFFDRHGNAKAKSEGAMNKEQLLRAVTELGLNK